MAIYIEGLNLPKDRFYPIHATIYADGSVSTGSGIGKFAVKAIEVSPHGDLIDIDGYRKEFMDAVYDLCADDKDNYRANAIIDLYDNAPTIIPASEEGDNG